IADLSVQASIRTLANQFRASFPRLDLLINNAALHAARRTVTPDGLETMFATNHLGYFLLTNLLIESLRAAPAARVLNISAPSTVKLDFDDLQSERRFRSLQAFGATKTANLLFTFKLARQLEGTPISANAVHPGIVRSGLMRESNVFLRTLTRVMGKPAEMAGREIADLGLAPEFAGRTGRFYHHGREIEPPAYTLDTAIQDRLWTASEQLTHITP
ncbi:MAG: SDR family NAD(P)-dependent oxidoreductase, partial [Anaerolineae bacterium]|nr:SDR family NAD(P)-dependent oxidoreductase [Anaerolineae bacterium]